MWIFLSLVVAAISAAPSIRPVYLDLFNTDSASIALELGVELSTSTSILQSSGSWIDIQWKNFSEYKGDEFIAWYSPASAIENLNEVAPVKYQFLSKNCTAPCRDGFLSFRLLNLRDEEGYAAGLFRGGLDTPILVSEVSGIVFENPHDEVMHPHIALTGINGEMRISWVTGKPHDANLDQFIVWNEFGSLESFRTDVVTSATYERQDMCGSPATTIGFHDPGLLHSTVLSGLKEGQSYRYTISNQFTGTFTTSSSSYDSTVRVAIFGDMGTAEIDQSLDGQTMERASLHTTSLLKGMLDGSSHSPSLGMVLHIGDISYARGYDVQWDEFFDQISPIASTVPWMVAPGNHERNYPFTSSSTARKQESFFNGYDSGGECGVPYSWRLPMPGNAGNPMLDAPWYGFNYGPIHFTVMSTEHEFKPGSPQFSFLAADLAAFDRSATPWLIFAGHRPMYVDSVGPGSDPCSITDILPCSADQPVASELREHLEPLLLKYKVDLAVWGHHHSYQRTCHIAKNRCISPCLARKLSYHGPIHLVLGMGGYELSKNIADTRPPGFEYVNIWEHGIGLVEANRTNLAVNFYQDSTGRIGDRVNLTKITPTAPVSFTIS